MGCGFGCEPLTTWNQLLLSMCFWGPSAERVGVWPLASQGEQQDAPGTGMSLDCVNLTIPVSVLFLFGLCRKTRVVFHSLSPSP